MLYMYIICYTGFVVSIYRATKTISWRGAS